MIKDISEKEYRAININSSSSLKDFSLDRRKYYKRHILKEKKKVMTMRHRHLKWADWLKHC